MRARSAYRLALGDCSTNMPPRPIAAVARRALRTPKAKRPVPIDASSSRSEVCTSTLTGSPEDSISIRLAFSGASLRSGGMHTR